MAYVEDLNQLLKGRVGIWWKSFASPADDPDWNSVAGFTQVLYSKQDAPLNIELTEEYAERLNAAMVAGYGRDLIGQSLAIKGTALVVNAYTLAWALGLLNANVTDKTAASPTRLQMAVGGFRVTNYGNIILRQDHPGVSGLYTGLAIIKGVIQAAGAIPLSLKEYQEIPIEIHAAALMSGTHAGKLGYFYEEYGAAAPAISGILPVSQTVGNAVVISGFGFGASRGASVVTFNSAKVGVTYLAWTDNSITVVIPAAAITGNVKVTVGGVDSNNVAYTIL